MKLNLGCGRNPLDGFVNLDVVDIGCAQVVFDLDQCATTPLPFDDDIVDEIVGVDLIEHIRNPLPLMAELWRVAKPDTRCRFELPYGSSDDAWEDPTHVRPYFLGSWGYFGQPYYWRADYGYRGDWLVEQIELLVRPGVEAQDVMVLRNCVLRQNVTLRAVKPARAPRQELMEQPSVKLVEVNS